MQFTDTSPGILDVGIERVFQHDTFAGLQATRRQKQALFIPAILKSNPRRGRASFKGSFRTQISSNVE